MHQSSSSLLILILFVFSTIINGHQYTFDWKKLPKVNHLLEKFTNETNTPCLIAGIRVGDLNGGWVEWTGSFGSYADIENNIRCSSQTMLKVASVSKAIGSALIARLVEQGKLSWDLDISHYIPKDLFPKKTYANKTVNITLRQLITHQSGIRHSNDKDFMHDWEFRIKNSTQLLSWFADDPLLFEPGHGYHYSNNGWSLIGAIVESIENRPYHLVLEDFMRNIIGMPSATSESRDHLIMNHGQQYRIVDGNVLPPNIVDILRPYPHWPAGGVVARIEDLLIYGQQMLSSYNSFQSNGKSILKQSTINEMWNYHNSNVSINEETMKIFNEIIHKIKFRYVMGWQRRDFPTDIQHKHFSILNELYYLSHTGEIGSANAKLAIFPTFNFTFAIITNRGSLKNHMDRLAIETLYYLFS
ncbi:hypothetical protein BLA29_004459 [Euroglyphus maynei]|uniref:Beta-lactamase-related domain-containing protein n=1 Tax=Euroglyphus maynei TaxID=6958 RepID=A0A1Y3AVI7_EURMA|nr:hypothetical protein BLA29_004459 [Euroglyphus maynei]